VSEVGAGERAARMTLTGVVEPGHPVVLAEVARHGAEAVLGRLRSGEHELSTSLAGRLAHFDLDRERALAARVGGRYVVPGDDEWPALLTDLADAPVLHQRGGVPIGLWVRGRAGLAEALRSAVAIVGSRSCTVYGSDIATEMAAEVTDAGFTVVSGAAFGVDQAAHRGCLARGGTTAAVLACGIDRVYPLAHRALIERIGQDGLLVSEAALGAAPTKIRFLARNRLIAAMSAGTVVVEAALRSGALNTASWAEGISRVVMGVPGSVFSEPSAGVHELIRTRGALLVTRAAEVLEAVAPMGQWTLPIRREPARPPDLLTDEQRQVLDAVPATRPAGLASIAQVAGLPPAAVVAALDVLVRADLVAAGSTGWHLRRESSS